MSCNQPVVCFRYAILASPNITSLDINHPPNAFVLVCLCTTHLPPPLPSSNHHCHPTATTSQPPLHKNNPPHLTLSTTCPNSNNTPKHPNNLLADHSSSCYSGPDHPRTVPARGTYQAAVRSQAVRRVAVREVVRHNSPAALEGGTRPAAGHRRSRSAVGGRAVGRRVAGPEGGSRYSGRGRRCCCCRCRRGDRPGCGRVVGRRCLGCSLGEGIWVVGMPLFCFVGGLLEV